VESDISIWAKGDFSIWRLHYDEWNAAPAIDYGTSAGTGHTKGGLIGVLQRFAGGGLVTNNRMSSSALQNFNTGGLAMRLARATAPPQAFAAGGSAHSAPAAAPEMQHWGKIDLTTNHGEFKVATERDTMRHLSSSAQRAKRFSTGNKPGWYGG
jgi:hypothetical protein